MPDVSDSRAESVLAGLDEQQRAVATSLRGPVVVLAGAGSGKTRAITHRIAYGALTGVHDPRRTLALTFTVRAAGELRSRLSTLGVRGVSARTFHSAALRQLRHFWPAVLPGEPPTLMNDPVAHVQQAASLSGMDLSLSVARDVLAEIEWAKAMLVPMAGYSDAVAQHGRLVPADLSVEQLSRIAEVYDETASAARVMDFQDVLLLLIGLLDREAGIADTVREQYRHITVDEFQDVSPLQHRLLQHWIGPERDICVVGDPLQTIYDFAGATADFLTGFHRDFPDAIRLELTRCYRCSPQIVAAANALAQAGSETSRVVLRAVATTGVPVQTSAHSDDVAEARALAHRISTQINDGMRPREIAVLVRTHAQVEPIADALHGAGIPVSIHGAARFFDRPEVRRAITLLRGAARADADPEISLPEQVRAALSPMSWDPTTPPASGSTRAAWESLTALVDLAADLSRADSAARLPDLVAELERRQQWEHAPEPDGVTITTCHAAKGLQWHAVHVAGLSEGQLPVAQAVTAAQIEQERRLLYVALTRARAQVHLSWSAARHPGQPPMRQASRFLADLRTARSGVLEEAGHPPLEQ